MLKVNLGCSIRRMRGWVNVDMVGNPTPNAEFVIADVEGRLPFDDESVYVMYAGHILEHLDPAKYHTTIAEWARVLIPGGFLIVEVPNGPWSMRLFLDAEERGDMLWQLRAMLALYGRADQGKFMKHTWAFSEDLLAGVLEQGGLEKMQLLPEINPIKAASGRKQNKDHPNPEKFDSRKRNISMAARKPYKNDADPRVPPLELHEIVDAIADAEIAELA